MSEVAEAPRFSCDGCGKSYRWKPELSKKRVKCKCGHEMKVPDLSAPPPAESQDGPPDLSHADIYDMIDAAPAIAPPRATIAMAAAAAAAPVATPIKKAPAAGGPPRKAQPLGYRGGPTPREKARNSFETFHDMKRDVYLPTALVVGSFLIYMGWLFWRAGGGSVTSFGVYAAVMAGVFLVKTLLMVGAAFIVAPMAGVSFGPIWTAILKLAALAMAPEVFATIVEESIGKTGGGLIASSLALGFYWILMSVLFQFDAAEAWTVVICFAVLRFLLSIIIVMVVLGALLGGSGIVADAAAGVAGAASGPQSTVDAQVAQWQDEDHTLPAKEVFEAGKLGSMEPLVKKIEAAGAKSVQFVATRDFQRKLDVGQMIVEWPKDPAARKTLLAELENYRKEFTSRKKPIVDEGNRYIVLPQAWFGKKPDVTTPDTTDPDADTSDEDSTD